MTRAPQAHEGDGVATAYRSRLPRLTRRVMRDLWVWMVAFGLAIGVAFPFAVIPLGVPADRVLRPSFFAATLAAGLLVAAVNHALTRAVIGVRLRALANGMTHVEDALHQASYANDWSSCSPEACQVPVDSDDELGEAAVSFNHLVDALAASNRQGDALRAASTALSTHLELQPLAAAAVQVLLERTGFDAAALLVVRAGRVELAASTGIQDAEALVDQPLVTSALTTNETCHLSLPDGVVLSAALIDFVPREVVVLPVRLGVVSLGALVMASAAGASDDDRRLVELTIPSLAVAVNNAMNHEHLQRVAALDPLTGLYNRRFGLERLREEYGRSVRTGDPLGVLMFDIDHFKAVNDTYGHLVGDRALQAIAQATRNVVREGDVVIRYGGEEFLVVLPGAGPHDVAELAERLRRAVESSDIVEGQHHLYLTVSLGAAAAPSPDVRAPEDLVGRADEALYTAKTSGRNRVALAA